MNEFVKPIFILSSERSGSTLIQYILDTHPDINCPGEIVLGKLCHQLLSPLSRTYKKTIKSRSLDHERKLVSLKIREIIDSFMVPFTRHKKVKIWCDKSPQNSLYLDPLIHVFPDAKFICLFRHPLDSIYSCMEGYYSDKSLNELSPFVKQNSGNILRGMVENWIAKNTNILIFTRDNQRCCHKIRYEDCVHRPSDEMSEVFAFLGLDWNDTILDDCFTMVHDISGGDNKIESTIKIKKDRIGKGKRLNVNTFGDDFLPVLSSLAKELGYSF